MSDFLENDQTSADYEIRRTSGGQVDDNPVSVPSPTSVAKVLQVALKLPLSAVDGVEVYRLDQTPIELSAADLEEPGPFEHQNMPSFFSYSRDGNQLGFVRPLREGDPSDTNARDFFQTGSGGSVRMTVRTHGVILTPAVSPTPDKPRPGQQTTLRASFGAVRPSGSTTYTWDMGDGTTTTTTTPSVTHAWGARGSWRVTLTVQQDDGLAAGVDTVTVPVRPPKAAGGPAPGSGDPHNPRNGGVDGNGTHDRGSPTSPGGVGTTGDRPGATSGQGNTPRRQQTGTASGKQKVTSAVDGDPVSGVLLDATSARTVRAQASAPRAAASPRRGGDVPRSWAWLLGALPVALIVGGMLRQTRWLAPRLPQPPWRNV